MAGKGQDPPGVPKVCPLAQPLQLGGLGSGPQWNPGNKNQGRKGRELGLATGFLGIFNIQASFKGMGSSLCSLSLMGRKSRIKHILQFASKIIPG